MRRFTSFSILLLSSVILFSCKKDKDSKTELLTSRTWHITQFQYRENTTDPWDIELVTDQCELDNIFTFLTSGTYTYTEGPTKCDPADPDLIDTGTWMFINDESGIRLTSAGDVIDFTIEQLDNNTLMIQYYDATWPEYVRIIFTH